MKVYSDTTAAFRILDALNGKAQKLDSLIYWAEWLENYDEEAALKYAQKAYDLATDRNWKYARAISAYRLAAIKQTRAKFGEDIEDALVDINVSKRIFDETDEDPWKVRIHTLMGRLYLRKGEKATALTFHEMALKNLEKIKMSVRDKELLRAEIHHDMSITLALPDSTTEAYFAFSDSIYRTNGQHSDRARLRLDLAYYYWHKGKLATADSLVQLSIDYADSVDDNDVKLMAYRSKGHLLHSKYFNSRKEEDFLEAQRFLHQSKNIQQEDLYGTYDLLGQTFYTKWAILETKFGVQEHRTEADSALHYFNLAIVEAREMGAFQIIENISANLVQICDYEKKKCGNFFGGSVMKYLNENYLALVNAKSDSSKEAFKRTNQVEQREILSSFDRKQKSMARSGFAVFLVALLVFLLILQQMRQKRLEARMEALRAQINPHFISNSLNAIESLVNLDKRKEAAKYIIHFSRLTRQILNGSREPLTTLDKELKTLEHFLALEQLRFRDKLNYEIELAEDLNPSMIRLPALILQPYIENAIWHGSKAQTIPLVSYYLYPSQRKEPRQLKCID